MNEYRICWFSRFGFPGEKSLCNVCIFHCIFLCSFTENMFAVNIVQGYTENLFTVNIVQG
jgi:hypothetical protein